MICNDKITGTHKLAMLRQLCLARGCAHQPEKGLMAARRRLRQNRRIRAKLVGRAQDWQWRSIHSHLRGQDDILAKKRGRNNFPIYVTAGMAR